MATHPLPGAPEPESPLAGPARASADRDWTVDVTARIESTVAAVRERTTVPATLVARGIVYGLVAGVLAAAVVVLVVMALVRISAVYLPFHPVGRRVWVTYAGASAIFILVGTLLWRMRRSKSA